MPYEWLTAAGAARYAKCSTPTIYKLVREKKLRAARITGTRDLRFLKEWIDEWLLKSAKVKMPAA